MERKPPTTVVLSFLLLSGDAFSQESVSLRVSAIVPPRPCEFPNRCDPDTARAPVQQSSASIDNNKLVYVGSTPQVTQTEDTLEILF